MKDEPLFVLRDLTASEFALVMMARAEKERKERYNTTCPKEKDWIKCKYHECDMDGIHCSIGGYGPGYGSCWVACGHDCSRYEESKK